MKVIQFQVRCVSPKRKESQFNDVIVPDKLVACMSLEEIVDFLSSCGIRVSLVKALLS